MKCCLCRSRKLKYALKVDEDVYFICQICTLLQVKDAKIGVDLSNGMLSFDYYPYILMRKLPLAMPVLFSLKSVEALLELRGYKVVNAQTTDEGKLEVQFEPLNSLEKIRLFELAKKLQSQFTYFLWTIKK